MSIQSRWGVDSNLGLAPWRSAAARRPQGGCCACSARWRGWSRVPPAAPRSRAPTTTDPRRSPPPRERKETAISRGGGQNNTGDVLSGDLLSLRTEHPRESMCVCCLGDRERETVPYHVVCDRAWESSRVGALVRTSSTNLWWGGTRARCVVRTAVDNPPTCPQFLFSPTLRPSTPSVTHRGE